MKNDVENMKSVMIFSPNDSEEETREALEKWWRHNQSSAVGDRNVLGVEETRRMLWGMG